MSNHHVFFFFFVALLVLGLSLPFSSVTAEPSNEPVIAAEVSNYKLGVGDTVRVQVYEEQDLSIEAKLTDAGTILYPFLGEIKASGLTIGQLADVITKGLKGRYLVDPKVSVTVMEYRPFFINGEVRTPGAYPYQPGLTVQKAVSIAGGFSVRASRSSVVIVHEKDPSRTGQEAGLDASVSPGDVITVEESFF